MNRREVEMTVEEFRAWNERMFGLVAKVDYAIYRPLTRAK